MFCPTVGRRSDRELAETGPCHLLHGGAEETERTETASSAKYPPNGLVAEGVRKVGARLAVTSPRRWRAAAVLVSGRTAHWLNGSIPYTVDVLAGSQSRVPPLTAALFIGCGCLAFRRFLHSEQVTIPVNPEMRPDKEKVAASTSKRRDPHSHCIGRLPMVGAVRPLPPNPCLFFGFIHSRIEPPFDSFRNPVHQIETRTQHTEQGPHDQAACVTFNA